MEKTELLESVATLAYKERVAMAERQKTARTAIICLTVLLLAAIVAGTTIAVKTITEQQYALNMQYAGVMELLNGVTITETGENGIIVQGDGNETTGGEMNG